MKTIHRTGPLWAVLFSLMTGSSRGQETTPKWDVSIPEAIADGTPAAALPAARPIGFTELTSSTKQMDVVLTPEMPDLPPVKGRINVTVAMVEDPKLPAPPPPLEALPPQDPAVVARLEELREKYRGTELVFLSCTVHDHRRTLLRIYPNGQGNQEVVAWSNLDFNHFSGFATYRVNDALDGTFYDFGLLMGIGNEETSRKQRLAQRSGSEYEAPEIPEMPDLAEGGPAFVVVEGAADSPAMDTLEQVHDLYRKEGARLQAAYHAREKAHAERKAFLLANPPQPEDVTIRFWKRGTSSPTNSQPTK